MNMSILHQIKSHKEVNKKYTSMPEMERLKIEAVIEEYWMKRSMNKSKCSKIWTEVRRGVMRGAIGGLVMGGGSAGGVVSGAVIFGAINGVLKGYDLLNSGPTYLLNSKQT